MDKVQNSTPNKGLRDTVPYGCGQSPRKSSPKKAKRSFALFYTKGINAEGVFMAQAQLAFKRAK